MSPHVQDNEDDLSTSESDDNLDEDIEALRSACMLTGTDPAAAAAAAASESDGGSDYDDDLELLRSIQNRFSVSFDMSQQPLSLRPLCSLPPATAVSDDDEDDFETLRAIQRRFASYGTNTLGNSTEDLLQKSEQARAFSMTSEKDTSNDLSNNTSNASEDFLDNEHACITTDLVSDNVESKSSGFTEWHQSDVPHLSTSPAHSSSFPKSAQMFFDAIKKNRSYQKFIRSKLIQIEARIEENKKLKERVKILKDFQVSCRKRTGRALSQKKDPRVQLISAQKLRASNVLKIDDKKVSAMHYGPAENSHVGNYRIALTKYSLSIDRKNWSEAEKENLGKGIRQQFQELMLQISVDRLSHSDASAADLNSFDDILASIKDHEITSEQIREFLPKVNWDQLASMYVAGRSGAECEARWLNSEDPLINHSSWTPQEDKNLLLIVQEMGISNWFNIAESLKTNRTPFQCLARYQRSLNACILKKEWTKEEDDQLRIAVETFGESDWQTVASTLEGRTGTQCSNRWKKSLHPMRQKVGRWDPDEDKRLKVAAMLFGAKNWKTIAQFVPGRTQVQCRERWVNSLDPSLSWGEWTEEEDSRLRAAIAEHGYCWSRIAACVPPRTDSQCRRRWMVLLPDEVPLLQAAKKIQKAALIGNFVDRESERPALDPKDFLPLPANSISGSEPVKSLRKRKRKLRAGQESDKEDANSCNISRPMRSKRPRKVAQICLEEEVPGMTNHSEVETLDGQEAAVLKKKRGTKIISEKNKSAGPGQDQLSSCPESTSLKLTNGPDKRKFDSSSKENICTEQDIDSQSLLLLPPERLELGITNVDGIEASLGATTTSNKKKRRPKQPSTRNIRTAESGDFQNSRQSSGKFMLSRTSDGTDMIPDDSSCPQSTPVLTITNGEEVDTFGRDDFAGRKRAPKLHSEGKMCKEPPNNSNGISRTTVSSEIMMIDNGNGDCVGFESLFVDKTTSNKKHCFLKKHYTRKKVTTTSDKSQDFVSVPPQDQIMEATDKGDDISLACFLRDTSRRKSFGVDKSQDFVSVPPQDQIMETTDKGDDTTLACFLRGTSRRKRSVAKSANLSCSRTLSRIDELPDENQMVPFILNNETQTRFNGGSLQNLSSCNGQSVCLEDIPAIKEPGSLNQDKGGPVAVLEPGKEQIAVHIDDNEDSNVTLACLRDKLRKGRQGKASK